MILDYTMVLRVSIRHSLERKLARPVSRRSSLYRVAAPPLINRRSPKECVGPCLADRRPTRQGIVDPRETFGITLERTLHDAIYRGIAVGSDVCHLDGASEAQGNKEKRDHGETDTHQYQAGYNLKSHRAPGQERAPTQSGDDQYSDDELQCPRLHN
jgi:hypothetical protein